MENELIKIMQKSAIKMEETIKEQAKTIKVLSDVINEHYEALKNIKK